MSEVRLDRGDRPPRMVTPPPGPRARALCRDLAAFEAPGINTLGSGPTILWREALGANVLDVDGNRYVDFTAGFGVAAVGHRPPAVVEAVRAQAQSLVHGLADVHAHPGRLELARRLSALAPVDDPRVYFAISGSDAVEIALKTARLLTGRSGVVAFDPGYHGTTLGALAATSRLEFRAPFESRLTPHVTRLPFGVAPGEIRRLLAHDDSLGCVVVEPVVGREGVLVPPDGWLTELAAACRDSDALLVADEIYTGFGRTGRRFAVDHEGVRPDLLCCGKALGGGLPIAAVVGRGEVLAAWQRPGEARHTATFVAHPLSCAAALATLDLLHEMRLGPRAAELGDRVGLRLAAWPDRFAEVVETRGRGLLWGVELASSAAAKTVARRALVRGLLLLAGGPQGRVVQIAPPLVVTDEQLDGGLAILEEALAAAV
ncbi:MAG: aspartate aminotransferase family protein [Thermoanaerobaculia bacterium]|nr:aspartate aminotransferase family protein [Thermoanaerobaculia bacterium]